MKRFTAIAGSFALLIVPLWATAAGLPVINSTTVNNTNGTLTINGQNFGSSPTITLNAQHFLPVSVTSTQIVANFPQGLPPPSFTPGTYFLTLTYANQLPSIFTVEIGDTGPQGPPGATGATGPQGVAGPAGAIGPTGPMGPPGSAGATGAAGTAGATGATGAIGPAGPVGPIGAAGAIGPAGPIGPQGPPGPQGADGAPGANGAPGQNGSGVVTDSTEDTAAGLNALVSLSTGSDNTALGFDALQATTAGAKNTAIGDSALASNTGGFGNTAVGHGALASAIGSVNTAVGSFALAGLKSGSDNTAVGESALKALLIGNANTSVGESAMGSTEIAGIGAQGVEVSNNTALGQNALFNVVGSDNIAIGHLAGYNLMAPQNSHNIAIGNLGTVDDVGIIRIGDGGPDAGGTHTFTYLSGIVVGHQFESVSDVNLKTDFREVEAQTILERLASLPVESWRFKNDLHGTRHIGPTAQDFYKAFAVGDDDKHIGVTDEGGVALAAAKALNERLNAAQDELREELARETTRTAQLEGELAELKKTVGALMSAGTKGGGSAELR